MRRFNDTYHNEAVIGKMGIVDKKWADRLMFKIIRENEECWYNNTYL